VIRYLKYYSVFNNIIEDRKKLEKGKNSKKLEFRDES